MSQLERIGRLLLERSKEGRHSNIMMWLAIPELHSNPDFWRLLQFPAVSQTWGENQILALRSAIVSALLKSLSESGCETEPSTHKKQQQSQSQSQTQTQQQQKEGGGEKKVTTNSQMQLMAALSQTQDQQQESQNQNQNSSSSSSNRHKGTNLAQEWDELFEAHEHEHMVFTRPEFFSLMVPCAERGGNRPEVQDEAMRILDVMVHEGNEVLNLGKLATLMSAKEEEEQKQKQQEQEKKQEEQQKKEKSPKKKEEKGGEDRRRQRQENEENFVEEEQQQEEENQNTNIQKPFNDAATNEALRYAESSQFQAVSLSLAQKFLQRCHAEVTDAAAAAASSSTENTTNNSNIINIKNTQQQEQTQKQQFVIRLFSILGARVLFP